MIILEEHTKILYTITASDVGKTVIIQDGTHTGGVAMIDEFVNASNATVETCGWNADLAAGTGIVIYDDYHSFTSPQLKVNNIGQTCEWENNAYGHTGEYATKLYCDASGALVTNLRLETHAQGFSNVDSLTMRHETGALASGNLSKVIRVNVDDELCTSSGAEVDGFKFTRTKGSSPALVTAVNVGTAFTNALKIDGAVSANPTQGYEFLSGYATVIDHVNSAGTSGDDAFVNAAVNDKMFTSNLCGIVIGSASPFAVIEYVAQVNGSATITPAWEYSTGDGTWATLTVSDATNGFVRSGKISFTPPATWAASAHVGDGGGGAAITSAYYIRIRRTKAANIATPATEQYFKTYPSASTTDTLLRGDGTLKLAVMADAAAPVDSIYYSTTASSMVWKDAGGVHSFF
ncbi:MAG TPA: hypothetical protein PLW50_00540 [Smithellaceae bacterium]|nr:hypothetical protein [Smithellaceae bacterium]